MKESIGFLIKNLIPKIITMLTSLMLFIFLENKVFALYALFLVTINAVSSLFSFGFQTYIQSKLSDSFKTKSLNIIELFFGFFSILIFHLIALLITHLGFGIDFIIENISQLGLEITLLWSLSILSSFNLSLNNIVISSGNSHFFTILSYISLPINICALSLINNSFEVYFYLFFLFKAVEFIFLIFIVYKLLLSLSINFNRIKIKDFIKINIPAYLGTISIDPVNSFIFGLILTTPSGLVTLGKIGKLNQLKNMIFTLNEVYNRLNLVEAYKELNNKKNFEIFNKLLLTTILTLIGAFGVWIFKLLFPWIFKDLDMTLSTFFLIVLIVMITSINSFFANLLVTLQKFYNDMFIRLVSPIILMILIYFIIDTDEFIYKFYLATFLSLIPQFIFYIISIYKNEGSR